MTSKCHAGCKGGSHLSGLGYQKRSLCADIESADSEDEEKQKMESWRQMWSHALLQHRVSNTFGSQKDATRLLSLLKNPMLPGMSSELRDALPKNYDQEEKTVCQMYGPQMFRYHICPNEECRGCIFRSSARNSAKCPNCSHDRFGEDGRPLTTMLYLPLQEYVRHLFRDEQLRHSLKVWTLLVLLERLSLWSSNA